MTLLNLASPIRRRRATKAEMEERRSRLFQILVEIKPATVRQTFYQASVAGIVPKTEEGYGMVQRLLVEMRRDGTIPFDWIVDNTRWVQKPRSYGSVAEALEDAASTYRHDLWRDAPVYVEVWVEKDALSGVILPITAGLDVPLLSARGYSSLTFLYEAAQNLAAQGRPCHVYHLGDYDPSGQNAAHKIEECLRDFAPGAEIHFTKLAVTPEQIRRWSLPSRPTKKTDTRSGSWGGGDKSVELDSIAPDDLRNLVREAIEQHVDGDALDRLRELEQDERAQLRRLELNEAEP